MSKTLTRLRRARRTRAKIAELRMHRLTVHRTPRHIYAQVIAPDTGTVLAAASTVQRDIRAAVKNGGNVSAATAIGKAIAEKTLAAGVKSVAFDRSGFKYHGRLKALAEAAREGGLEF
ncbi:MAG: 50S ribosomal protein L18 [Gammaproteobacteria bacterium]|nr:50S ribosomal protein L18 [Gammaproteobacteria bacterium]